MFIYNRNAMRRGNFINTFSEQNIRFVLFFFNHIFQRIYSFTEFLFSAKQSRKTKHTLLIKLMSCNKTDYCELPIILGNGRLWAWEARQGDLLFSLKIQKSLKAFLESSKSLVPRGIVEFYWVFFTHSILKCQHTAIIHLVLNSNKLNFLIYENLPFLRFETIIANTIYSTRSGYFFSINITIFGLWLFQSNVSPTGKTQDLSIKNPIWMPLDCFSFNTLYLMTNVL